MKMRIQMTKPTVPSAAILFFALFSLLPIPLQAQDAAQIMRRALEVQAERLAGIENLTIIQEVMGMETSVYMEKREVDGTPVLFPVSVSVGGMTNQIPEDMAQGDWASPFQEAWVDRVRIIGEETLDGVQVQVLAIDDFSDLEIPGMPGGGQEGDFQPKMIKMWLDTDDFLTRKVEMSMSGRGPDGTVSDIHMELFMEDYREVEGYLHPFSTRTVTEGFMESADVDQAELRQQLDQMKAQLDNMPEAQRAMMEEILGAQIQQIESMLGGDGGMEMTITVKEIRVNSGSPA